MLAICTRTKNEDYEFKGDVNAYNNFKEHINRFNFLYDTTKPLAILDEEYLFIAGIATERKDKVNTVIRYSLFYAGEKSRVLFNRFREALKKDNAKTLGDKLDTLLMPNNELGSLNFNIPDEESFLRILDTVLPKNSQTQTSNFAIWTTFCPSERSDQAFENFLLSKRNLLPHHGTIEVDSLTPQSFSKLAQKKTRLVGREIIKNPLILLCGICLGVIGANLVNLYSKPSELAEKSHQIQKKEEEIIPQTTGIIVLKENHLSELPVILKEKNLKELQNHMIRLQIPLMEAETSVILIPVYSPNHLEHQLEGTPTIQQMGPIYLTLWENLPNEVTVTPVKKYPTDVQQIQKIPESIPPKKTDQNPRTQKDKK